jgi:transketolase
MENSTIERASKGGYVLHEEEAEQLTIVATGSEVSIALEAAGKLLAQGIRTRVVSLPCWLVFDQQPQDYRLSVLRSGAPILSLEALSVRYFVSYFPHRSLPNEGVTDRWLGKV